MAQRSPTLLSCAPIDGQILRNTNWLKCSEGHDRSNSSYRKTLLVRQTSSTYQVQLFWFVPIRPSPVHLHIFLAAFNGYNGVFDEACLDNLRNDPAVALIEPDYLANISYSVSPFQTSNPPARHRPRASLMCTLLGMCTAAPQESNGSGVDIYGLGERFWILTRNQAFSFARDNIPCIDHESLTDLSTRHWYLHRARGFRTASCARSCVRRVQLEQ